MTRSLFITPLEKMCYLDGKGQSYYLRNITTIMGHQIKQADVMAHGPEFVEIRIEGVVGATTWLRWEHMTFELVVE